MNGSGDCRFLLAAVDGDVSGGGGVDRFRTKIWSRATGDLVYDNQLGAADDASPTTHLSGASISVHD